tara:strand:+ start:2481 stop:3014 length:534 start_codon:yes stop_codon:yes gene_type:complete
MEPFDKDQKQLLSYLKKVANKRVAKGPFNEFNSLIAELAVCELKNYIWQPSEGYDAISQDGEKIQIKTRMLPQNGKLLQSRISRFGSAKSIKNKQDNYKFDRGNLAVLDGDLEIAEIWDLPVNVIQTRESAQKKRMQKSGNEAARLLGLKFSNFIKQPAQQHYHVDFLSVGKRLGLQ